MITILCNGCSNGLIIYYKINYNGIEAKQYFWRTTQQQEIDLMRNQMKSGKLLNLKGIVRQLFVSLKRFPKTTPTQL
jgi:hypothetical protein